MKPSRPLANFVAHLTTAYFDIHAIAQDNVHQCMCTLAPDDWAWDYSSRPLPSRTYPSAWYSGRVQHSVRSSAKQVGRCTALHMELHHILYPSFRLETAASHPRYCSAAFPSPLSKRQTGFNNFRIYPSVFQFTQSSCNPPHSIL